MGKKYFEYSSQEFDSDVLDLGNQNGFFFASIWVVLKSLKKYCQGKKKFYCSLTGKNVSESFLWNENYKRLSRLVFKCDISLLADVFEKCSNSSLKILDYVQVIVRIHQL